MKTKLISAFCFLLSILALPAAVTTYPGGLAAATQAEVDAGVVATKAVTPATLAGWATVVNSGTNGITTNALAALRPATRWTTNTDSAQINGATVTNVTAVAGWPTQWPSASITNAPWLTTNSSFIALSSEDGSVVITNNSGNLKITIDSGASLQFSDGDLTVNGGFYGNGSGLTNLIIPGALTNNTTGNASTATTASAVASGVTNAWQTYSQSVTNGGDLLRTNSTITSAQVLVNITNVTTAFTIPVTVNFVTATSSSSSFTNTLPASPATGYSVIVKRTGVNVVYVAPNAGQTIDGSSATVALNTAIYETRGFVWNGSTWWIW